MEQQLRLSTLWAIFPLVNHDRHLCHRIRNICKKRKFHRTSFDCNVSCKQRINCSDRKTSRWTGEVCYSISPPNTTRFSSLALQHGLQQVSAGYLPLHQCRIRQSPLPQAATSATNVANAMGLSELSHQRFRVITTTTSFACFTPQLLNTEMLCLAHVDEEHAFERIDSTLKVEWKAVIYVWPWA